MSRTRLHWWAPTLGLVCLALPIAAQVDTGTILGTVRDPSGAVVPGVENAGYDAIASGEQQLQFLSSDPSEPEITESHIRESIANRAFYRLEYARAGMADPYNGAPL